MREIIFTCILKRETLIIMIFFKKYINLGHLLLSNKLIFLILIN